jgi:hypothetical protein
MKIVQKKQESICSANFGRYHQISGKSGELKIAAAAQLRVLCESPFFAFIALTKLVTNGITSKQAMRR